mgnify:CR=1 FL=1
MKQLRKALLVLLPILLLALALVACGEMPISRDTATLPLADGTPKYRGEGDDGTTWAVYADGTLVIDGACDEMDDYEEEAPAWAAYAGEVTCVKFGSGVKHISTRAFANMRGIIWVDFGGVGEIGAGAFTDCVNLRRVVTPDTLKTIGDNAFSGCYRLREVKLAAVTEVGTLAFGGCPALVSVEVPEGLDMTDAFDEKNQVRKDGSGYRKITTDENGFLLDGTVLVGYDGRGTEISIPAGITQIGDYAFYMNTQITSVVIPDTVTGIGAHSFENCSAVRTVSIGRGVGLIGDSAFRGCARIETVEFSAEDCTSYPADGGLFAGLPSLSSLLIGSDVTELQAGMFEGCTALRSVRLSDRMDAIPERLFAGCTALSDVVIGSATAYIREGAFRGCCSLKNVDIPATVKTIFKEAFCDTGLIRLVLPSVSKIQDNAFYGCSSLVSVVLGTNGSLTISAGAFGGCYKLIDVVNHSTKTLTAGRTTNGQVAYYTTFAPAKSGSSRVQEQDGYLFFVDPANADNVYLVGYAGNDAELTLPASFGGKKYSIYKYAFRGESGITSVKLSAGVSGIGYRAFCDALRLGTFDASAATGLTTIGEEAFRGCGALTGVALPGTLTDIGACAFYRCPALGAVVIPDGVTAIGEAAFSESGVTALTFGRGVTTVPTSVAYGCDRLTQVNFLGGVTGIGNAAFDGCVRLAEITLPATLKTIGPSAFRGAERLLTVVLPDSVTSVGAGAFEDCERLVSVTVGAGLGEIGAYAFRGCDRLFEVVNHGNTTLQLKCGDASYGAIALNATNIRTATAVERDGDFLWLEEGGVHYLLGYVGSATELTLPVSKGGAAYEIAPYAFAYADVTKVTLGDKTVAIGERAFMNAALTEVTLNASLRKICNHAFASTPLTRVTFTGYACEKIGDGAFRDCQKLVTLEVKSDGTSLGFGCFTDCVALREVTFKASDGSDNAVTSIGAFCFNGAVSMARITIPKSVRSIGKYWFADCLGLVEIVNKSVQLIGDVSEINVINKGGSVRVTTDENGFMFYGDQLLVGYVGNAEHVVLPKTRGTYRISAYAFYGLSNIKSITISDSVTGIGAYAFAGCTGLSEIYLPGGNMTSAEGVGKYIFEGCSEDLAIYVDFPDEEALTATGRWSPVWNCRLVNYGHEYRVTGKYWQKENAGQVYAIPYLVNYGASARSADQVP